jgi:hypothetical protein
VAHRLDGAQTRVACPGAFFAGTLFCFYIDGIELSENGEING